MLGITQHTVRSDAYTPKRRRLWTVVFCLGSLAFAPALAQTANGERLALVVGNGAYRLSPLANPKNDAVGMGSLLLRAGFKVDQQVDATQEQLRAAVVRFGEAIRDPKVKFALFYYAGHGVQLDWRNYLIPVNADVRSAEDVRRQSVDVSDLLRYMEQTKGKSFLVILDACRDDPFAGTYRTAAKGLSQFDAPAGSLLAYSTSPGNVAQDGDGENGLYTGHLLREFSVRGTKLEDAFKRVRLNVRLASRGQQIPWESTSLEDDVYLFESDRKKLSDVEQDALLEKEITSWLRVKSSNDATQLADFIREYPSGSTSELAQYRLNRLLTTMREQEEQRAAAATAATAAAAAEIARTQEAERLAQERIAVANAQAAALQAQRLAAEQAEAARAQAVREEMAKIEASRQAAQQLAAEQSAQQARLAAIAQQMADEARVAAQAQATQAALAEAARALESSRIAAQRAAAQALVNQQAAQRADAERQAREAAELRHAEAARAEQARLQQEQKAAEIAQQQALAQQASLKLAAAQSLVIAPAVVASAAVKLPATPYYKGFDEHRRQYAIGDKFEFQVIDQFSRAASPFVMQVTAFDSTKDRVEYNNGEYASDSMGNILKNLRGSFDMPRQFYPAELFVGKKWYTRFKQARAGGVAYTFYYNLKVVGKEQISVPAGTFEAYKIEARGFNVELGASLQRNIWVTPGISADIVHETIVRLRNGKIDQYDRQELVRYAAAQGVLAGAR